MNIKKVIIHTFLIVFMFSTSLIQSVSGVTTGLSTLDNVFSINDAEAAPKDEDWYENGKTSARTRMVDDSDLKPLILYKAKLNLGWSVSQVIAVGEYFYILAAIPSESAGSGNFFGLSSGTYLYRIPVDFKFKGNLSNAQLREDLIEKGASAVYITGYTQTYSHPTYNPSNGLFYVGVGTKVYVVDENPFKRLSTNIDTGARLTGAPMIVGNDVVMVGTSTDDTNGGRVYLAKGLGTNNSSSVTGGYYQISNLPNAEIASAAAITSNSFGIGVNFRDSGREGYVLKLTANDRGFGNRPTLSTNWTYTTDVGVAATPMYYGSHIYATSKYGTVYKLRQSSGTTAWSHHISNVTLINNTPTTDGQYIYQPVRRPGKLVKINISNGSQAWSIAQGLQINGSKIDSDLSTGKDVANDATYWKTPKGQDLVFYGDTGGQLDFLTTNGLRTKVALDKATSTISRSSIKGSHVEGGTDWEYQGTGTATELLLAKNHLIFGVNTTSRMGETWFYSVGVADDVYVKSIQGGEYKTGQRALTKVVVGSKDFSAGTRVPVVRFYVDGKLIEEKRIDLKPGEEKEMFFMWTVGDTPKQNGKLTATINIPEEFVETDMTNNTMDARYSSEFGYNICDPDEQKDTAIVKIETVCDTEGDCYDVYYYEYLTTIIGTPSPKKLRAGYGFMFDVDTLYIDETDTYHGPKRVNTEFPDSPNYVDKINDMNKTKTSGSSLAELSKWELPLIFVEKYSGNVFYKKNDSRMDPDDELVLAAGERRWYTDFYTQDGPYIFKAVARDAGKNNLTSCFTEFVEVKGTPFDDYVRRSVIPDKPFLDSGKVGFNWKGKENRIGDLKDFYYNPHNNADGASTYYLNKDVVKEIKDTELENISKSGVEYFFSSYNFTEKQ
ncbi:outer membrane protein assembly factor BamB family protein [Viridibacillus arvi]|uniref:outer membrane protein assembly factor BamB family protein n=1 Tax=Viridibacillus arvi TaxID=263475 RepID=UPI0034CD8101